MQLKHVVPICLSLFLVAFFTADISIFWARIIMCNRKTMKHRIKSRCAPTLVRICSYQGMSQNKYQELIGPSLLHCESNIQSESRSSLDMYPVMGYCGPIRIGPSIQFFFSFPFSDTQWIRIHGVSETYPYLICIRRVSVTLW
jgi:hypothetical protein